MSYLRYLAQSPERIHLRALGQLGTLQMLAGTAVDLVAAHAVARPDKADLPRYGARLFRRMVEVGSRAGAGAARDGLLPPRLEVPFRPLTHAFFGLDIGEDYIQRLEDRVSDGLRRLGHRTRSVG